MDHTGHAEGLSVLQVLVRVDVCAKEGLRGYLLQEACSEAEVGEAAAAHQEVYGHETRSPGPVDMIVSDWLSFRSVVTVTPGFESEAGAVEYEYFNTDCADASGLRRAPNWSDIKMVNTGIIRLC